MKNNHNENILLTSTSSYLNDRLRKRRCFADKELDSAFILPSFTDRSIRNSSVHFTHSSNIHISNHHQKQQQQQHLVNRTISNQKKCTDFSVAAIIGNS